MLFIVICTLDFRLSIHIYIHVGVDVNSEKKLEDLVVQFFHGFSHMTVKKEAKPRTGLIITSNSAFANTER